jgi:hypothetical protein
MRTRTCSFLLTAGVALSAASCLLHNPPPTVPVGGTVDRAVVRSSGRSVVITDPAVIDRFLTFLAARRDGWEKVLYTPPPPAHTVTLERDGERVLCIDLDPGVMATYTTGLSHRRLSEKDYAEACAILGLPADTPSTR